MNVTRTISSIFCATGLSTVNYVQCRDASYVAFRRRDVPATYLIFSLACDTIVRLFVSFRRLKPNIWRCHLRFLFETFATVSRRHGDRSVKEARCKRNHVHSQALPRSMYHQNYENLLVCRRLTAWVYRVYGVRDNVMMGAVLLRSCA